MRARKIDFARFRLDSRSTSLNPSSRINCGLPLPALRKHPSSTNKPVASSALPSLLVVDAEHARTGTKLRPGKPEFWDEDQRLQLRPFHRPLEAHAIGVPRRVGLEIDERACLRVGGIEPQQPALRLRLEGCGCVR